MGDVLLDFKVGVMQRRRHLKDLARELPMDYSRLGRILNGFENPPLDFSRRVNKVFQKWDDLFLVYPNERQYKKETTA
jgi:hypothetical protein